MSMEGYRPHIRELEIESLSYSAFGHDEDHLQHQY